MVVTWHAVVLLIILLSIMRYEMLLVQQSYVRVHVVPLSRDDLYSLLSDISVSPGVFCEVVSSFICTRRIMHHQQYTEDDPDILGKLCSGEKKLEGKTFYLDNVKKRPTALLLEAISLLGGVSV